MASAPVSTDELIDLVRKSGLAEDRLDKWLRDNPELPPHLHAAAAKLVQDGLLTSFHAKHMLAGKFKGFVLGSYKVLDQIGAGGMGVVFLAEHLAMKRQVAIKVLPADKAADHESRERFYREARMVAALDHPNVVQAYDIGQNGETHFMVMEYVDGESLEHMLRRRGPLPFRDAADYIAQSARGLQHAHERGLVHRDIKPGNLLLDKTGVIKVLDMGLARFFEENSNLTTEMCSGSVIGTADYMAPEQAVNSHDVDIRADIYSLGVTLYALLTGQPPYGNLTVPQKLLAHHMREPNPIQDVRPDVPDELADIVMKMMAKKPVDRYQTPGEIDADLTDWLKQDEIASAHTAKSKNTIIHRHLTRPSPVAPKRRWLWPAIIGSGVLAIGIAVAIAATGGKPAPSTTEPVASGPEATVPDPTNVRKMPIEPKLAKPKVGQIRTFDTKGESIERLALSPDQKHVAGGSRNGFIKVWEVETGKLVKELKPHTGMVWCVAWSPDGKYLSSCGQDGQIKLHQADSWREHKKMSVNGQVWSGAFSPDSKTLFTGGEDGHGRFWDVESGNQIREIEKPHDKTINWVAWSPDGSMTYTAGWDNSLRGWDAATGQMKFNHVYNRKFQVVAVSPDSKSLVAGADTPMLQLFDAKTGKKNRDFGTAKMASMLNAAFTNDGTLMVATGNEGAVRVWDVETMTPYHTFTGHTDGVPGCAITADGKHVITSSRDKTVRLWALPER